ncbi:2-oxoglutarate (2OG) and Fe(II)-dependent oxygenase superfamily protein [Striga asiatica]|uniref:2-oxoglutarate (2OG) and Fe(II)-dependent oxygenase superfamily protein n=1 Tax=Striga asiatica TaxID=4170 RepID=A0A5A7R953_STRAF|nr:2-oxoglutarate (2OG) and Fe(II)-dependent oxygenase superfamily protein [Striga asiatica]
MANDHGTSGVTNALLALLQERFRQLEKMKELRQEKELLRMLSESRKYACDYNHEMQSEKRLRSSEIFYPPKPNCQLSLSLWPDSSAERPADSRATIASTDGPFVCTSQVKMENSGYDVDTSLRL